jgi:hypothetical protein
VFQRLIPTGERSGLQTHIAMTESVHADELLTAFAELESAIRARQNAQRTAEGVK